MNLQELYAKKGDLITTIEIAQAQLQEVNKKIVEEINKIGQVKKEEEPKEKK